MKSACVCPRLCVTCCLLSFAACAVVLEERRAAGKAPTAATTAASSAAKAKETGPAAGESIREYMERKAKEEVCFCLYLSICVSEHVFAVGAADSRHDQPDRVLSPH